MIYTATTHSVKVSVKAKFESHLSDPSKSNNIFTYYVVIENMGSSTVQLLKRHWKILDNLHPLREIKGPGVIGEQPIIEPGGSHEYESWCNLHSDIGKMWGSYVFQRIETESVFHVEIPEFQLVLPSKLN